MRHARPARPTPAEWAFDGKQLAAVLRIKALRRLNCCSLAVYGFGEGDRAGSPNFYPDYPSGGVPELSYSR
jgi:hypothetical protein